MYNCDRCGYKTPRIYLFKKHLSRKNICKALMNDVSVYEIYNKQILNNDKLLVCDYCDRGFSNKQNINRHFNGCKEYLKILEMQEKIKEQQEEIDKLKMEKTTEIKNYNGNNANNSHSYNTNCHNTTTNIQVNAFGKENMDYLIKSPDFEKLLMKCLKNKRAGLLEMIENKYFNVEHPENHTIKKMVKNDKFVKCYNGKKWLNEMVDDAISRVLSNVGQDISMLLDNLNETNEDETNSANHLYFTKILKDFIKHVGLPLDYDFSDLKWDCDNVNVSDDVIEKRKKDIQLLVGAVIYEKSLELFK